MDITNNLNNAINMIINLITYTFDKLNSIEFAGISLLEYSITILVVSVILPLLFTLVNSSAINGGRNYANERKRIAEQERRKKERQSKKGAKND